MTFPADVGRALAGNCAVITFGRRLLQIFATHPLHRSIGSAKLDPLTFDRVVVDVRGAQVDGLGIVLIEAISFGVPVVASEVGDSTPQRGGRAKRYYRLRRPGVLALTRSRETHAKLWQGLELDQEVYGR